MTEDNLSDLLQRGITAAKAGRRQEARTLLTQATEQDERNLIAWLWLSGVVDNLDDREVCLENVLSLDPNHTAARNGLEWVRAQKAAQLPPLPETTLLEARPSPASTSAERRQTDVNVGVASPQVTSPGLASDMEAGPDLDAYACPYCAAPTQPERKECKACHRELVHIRYKRESPSTLYWVLIGLMVINLLSNAVYTLIWFAAMWAPTDIARQYLLPGQSAANPHQIVSTMYNVYSTIVFFQLMFLILALRRSQSLYVYLVFCAAISFAFVSLVFFFSFNPLLCFAAIDSGLSLVLWLRVGNDFAGERRRLLCVPDGDISSHSAFYARGQVYARKKMWALAAVHFRRAVGSAPGYASYHVALATAYIKLKRYRQALSAAREAKRIAPGDSKVDQLNRLLEEAVAKEPH